MKILSPILVIMALMSPGLAYAARIVSDPWPTTENQPDSCAYIEGTMAAVISPVETVTGGVRCSISLVAVSPGNHTYKVFAKSTTWGDSGQVNFTFAAGIPTIPSGLRIVP